MSRKNYGSKIRGVSASQRETCPFFLKIPPGMDVGIFLAKSAVAAIDQNGRRLLAVQLSPVKQIGKKVARNRHAGFDFDSDRF